MRLHPRHGQTTQARIDIGAAVISAAQKHELTYAELIGILAAIIASWTRFEIRDERAETIMEKGGDIA